MDLAIVADDQSLKMEPYDPVAAWLSARLRDFGCIWTHPVPLRFWGPESVGGGFAG